MKSQFPSFFIIGAQKAGTTTLHDLLSKELPILLPTMKETHFFSDESRYTNGIDWYFDSFKKGGKNCIQGEVDPDYLFFTQVPERIAEFQPAPNIVVVLRHPLQRAFSQYRMSVRRGVEKLSFKDALLQEEKRLITRADVSERHHSYLSRGRYAKQIQYWQKSLPDANFLFIKFDALIDPATRQGVYQNICSFIGIESRLEEKELDIVSNPASQPRSQFVTNLLWGESGLKKALRPMLRRLFPNKRVRGRISEVLDKVNRRATSGKKDAMHDIPLDLLNEINDEIEAAQKLTGLDFSDWILK